jgi:hypothetical protein
MQNAKRLRELTHQCRCACSKVDNTKTNSICACKNENSPSNGHSNANSSHLRNGRVQQALQNARLADGKTAARNEERDKKSERNGPSSGEKSIKSM